MKKFSSLFKPAAVALFAVVFLSNCAKKDFDQPTTANIDPSLTANKSISELIAMAVGPLPTLIDTNVIVSGVIVGDDAAGNFYKEMIIQDTAAGISVQLDQSNFSSSYPVGRRVFIKCKGLYIADDGDGNYELGILAADTVSIGRIPSTIIPQYIEAGQWGVFVIPKSVTMNDLATVPSNTLIKLNNVEFETQDVGQPYADAANLQSESRYVEDCFGKSIQVYTSGFASFASSLTAAGHGSIVAVYKMYGSSGELIIRDLNDVNMTSPRGSSGPVGTGDLMTIADLVNVFAGCAGNIISGTKIRGTIISDIDNKNINARNIVVQQGLSGIVVRFTANNSTLKLNDSVEINIGGGSLQAFNGLLEVDGISNSKAVKLGTGNITPNVVTISQIKAAVNTYQSTLIKLIGVTFPVGTFSGSKVVTQGTSTINMYTASSATFASTTIPTGTRDLTAIVNVFGSTAELNMRNASDVQ